MEENQGIDIAKIINLVKQVWSKSIWPYKWLILVAAIAYAGWSYNQERKRPIIFSGGTSFMLESEDITSHVGSAGINSNLMLSNFIGNEKSNKTILMALFVSNKMKELTLLTPAKVDGKTDLLVNHFLRLQGAPKDSSGYYGFDTTFKYGEDPMKDSRLRQIANSLKSPDFHAGTSEEGLFYLLYKHRSEDFVLALIKNHIEVISNYYIKKRLEKAEKVLEFSEQHRDDVKKKLAGAEYSLAALLDRSNGAVMHRALTDRTKLERKVEVYNNMYISAEVTYQSAKVNVLKKTPYIQIIDDARAPLSSTVIKPTSAALTGFVIVLIVGIIICIALYFVMDFISKQKELLRESKEE